MIGGHYRWRPAGRIGRALQRLVVCSAATTVVVNIILFVLLQRQSFVVQIPHEPVTLPPLWFPWAESPWAALLAVVSLLSHVTVLVWLVWQHRATANLWAIGNPHLRVTPGWAVGWWFVPIAQLWMPLVAMVELDRGSRPAGSPRRSGAVIGV